MKRLQSDGIIWQVDKLKLPSCNVECWKAILLAKEWHEILAEALAEVYWSTLLLLGISLSNGHTFCDFKGVDLYIGTDDNQNIFVKYLFEWAYT